MKREPPKKPNPPIEKVRATKKEIKEASQKIMEKYKEAIKRLANR